MDASDPRHGTANGYNNRGCRCDRCRLAWSIYCREHRAVAEINARINERYHIARSAGYSGAESRRRQFWSDPLRLKETA
jgi:hypothetical protein